MDSKIDLVGNENKGKKAEYFVYNEALITNQSTEDYIEPKSDHFETYERIHSLNLVFGSVVGLKVDPFWKYNNLTRWTFFLLNFSTAMTVYSMILVKTDPSKLIETASIVGIIIPAFAKFDVMLNYSRNALALVDFLEHVFKNIVDGPKAKLLKTHIDETFVSIKICLLVETLALLLFLCYPVYAYVNNDELVQLIPMQFPFIDQSNTTGFIIANMIMVKLGLWAFTGSVGFDLYLARLIDSYCALVKLLQYDIIEFAEMSREGSGVSRHYRKTFLRNFLLKCQDKDRFIQNINDVYADVIFKQFSCVYMSMVFTIYAIIRNKWYSGFGIVVFFLVEIYILCFLGTTIKNENDKFCHAIYDMPWYDYSLSEQRIIQILLHSSQNTMELWIGVFAPLNVETAVEITKSIYSTSTMIMNTSE
ncbi:Odorant receptor 67d [Pseudolycoriella hygida]|uniref:Odorant receptor n=1 Tax=Pseudolycoriella hygida TaxID=35572 RepID=A0A9Q0MQD4_9DIPT|nr:Odorant receptor 67d [Pseudolycoriella hygida]